MPIELLLAFSLVFLLDSLAPGPAVAAVVAKGATTKIKRTVPFILGLVIGEVVFFVLALSGLVALVAAMGPMFVIIKWAGIAYLVYLAFSLWRAPPMVVSTTVPDGEGFKLIGVGLLVALGNPMTIGFYLALLPAVVDVGSISFVAALQMGAIIIAVWGGVLLGYGLLADRASRLIATPRAQTWLNRTAAGAILGAAGTIASRQ